MLRLDPSRSWPERLWALWRNICLVVESVISAGVATTMWYVAWSHGYHFNPKADARAGTIILVLAAIFAIQAALTSGKVGDRSVLLSEAVRTRNKTNFMIMRDIRIPMRIHMLLSALGLGMLFLISCYGFEDFFEGVVCVFISWFGMAMYLLTTLDLQNPRNSMWFRKTAPDDWLCENADAFFENETTDNVEPHPDRKQPSSRVAAQ